MKDQKQKKSSNFVYSYNNNINNYFLQRRAKEFWDWDIPVQHIETNQQLLITLQSTNNQLPLY